MDELLRQTLRGDPGLPPTESCLDAEMLAAWTDGGLDAHATVLAESHVAGCARCQALLGAMGRSAVATPAPDRWWSRVWLARWWVPLAAGAAAAALFVMVPRQRQPTTPAFQEAPAQARADAPTSPTGVAGALAPAPSARPETPPAQPPAAEPASPARQGARNKDSLSPAQLKVGETLDAPVPVSAERAENSVTATPPAAPPASARTSARAPAPALSTVPSAAAPGLAREPRADQAASAREVVSPDPAIRWRLDARGAVEYTTNGGSGWEPLSTGIASELTAGASPAPAVCWLVGRGGVVLLTTDGRRWQRVPFPEPVDLAAVQAVDAQSATVTTAAGRAFRTTTGGQIWLR